MKLFSVGSDRCQCAHSQNNFFYLVELDKRNVISYLAEALNKLNRRRNHGVRHYVDLDQMYQVTSWDSSRIYSRFDLGNQSYSSPFKLSNT